MTGQELPPKVDAGQMLMDILRSMNPRELEVVGVVCRHHTERCKQSEEYALGLLWFSLGVSADVLLAEHPAALNDMDHADLDSLGEFPDEAPGDV